MGCRRPTGGVFTYVCSDTSHAEGVPHSDPLGNAVRSSHEGELEIASYDPFNDNIEIV